MRVPEMLLRGSAVLVELDSANIPVGPLGSVFFIGVPFATPHENYQFTHPYVITAKHCVDRHVSAGMALGVVVKTMVGPTPETLVVSPNEWRFHPTADVAVARIEVDVSRYRMLSFRPVDMLMQTPEMNDKEAAIGLGDDVLFPGLLEDAGDASYTNLVVRSGTIAAMFMERIPMDSGYTDGHLIEARSVGGFSGSVVFVRRTVTTKIPKPPLVIEAPNSYSSGLIVPDATRIGSPHEQITVSGLSNELIVLGMIQGHLPVSVLNKGHSGISVVIPASHIIEVLYGSEAVRLREIFETAFLEKL